MADTIRVTLADGRTVKVQTDDPNKAAQIAHKWSQENPQPTRRYTVKSPDGRTFTVTAPEGATKEQVLAKAQQAAKAPPPIAKGLPKHPPKKGGGGWGAQFLDGVIPGTSEALGGAFEALNDLTPSWLKYGKGKGKPAPNRSLGEAYDAGHHQAREDNKAWAMEHPAGAAASQLGGFGAGLILPTTKVAQGASLAQKAKAASQAGGIYGLLSGAMSSESDGLAGKASDAASTGIIGSMVGAASPYALRTLGAVTAPLRPIAQPAVRMFGKGMEGLGDILPGRWGKVLSAEGEQLARDPVTARANRELDQTIRATLHPTTGAPMRPTDVAEEVRRRQGLGVPAVPADLGDVPRGRFATSVRTPGPAQQTVRRAIDARQAANAQRAGQHITEALGPTGDVQGQAQALNEAARAAAAPLYAKSDAHPVPVTAEVQELFSRPSGRKALARATRSVQDQGLSPFTEGRIQAPDGSWTTGRVPTMPVYDNAKTHLDEEVFGGQSAFATPEARRDGQGARSIRAKLLALMDGEGIETPTTTGTPGTPAVPREALNPHWKPARDAYAGPVQSRKALELGEEMAGAPADDIAARLDGMTADQTGFFRLGHRSGLASDLKSLPDYGDATRRLAGSVEKREGIAAAHGPEAAERLQERLGPEQDATRTWEAVRGASGAEVPDIAAQDQHIADAGKGILQVFAGHPGPGLLNVGRAVVAGQRGGQKMHERIATVLAESDPAKLDTALSEVLRERARKRMVDRNASKATQGAGRFLGSILGTNLTEPLEEQPDY